jgi:tetratricopeptide (TPR) repeat protein
MYDDAIYCYDQALIFEPKNSYFLEKKADTLKLLNRWIEVFECHQKIREIDPDFIDT